MHFTHFKETGDLFNQELAAKFREYVHAKNSLYEGMDAYVRFRGQAPTIDGLLKQRGLN
jgi:peptidyl-dipeptidase Dcp